MGFYCERCENVYYLILAFHSSFLLDQITINFILLDYVQPGDRYATRSMYEALQQVKRAVRKTNFEWESNVSVCNVDDPNIHVRAKDNVASWRENALEIVQE